MTYTTSNGYNFKKTSNAAQTPYVDTYNTSNARNFKKDSVSRKKKATGGAVTTPVAPQLNAVSSRTATNLP